MFALKTLLRRKMRTGLSIAGVAVGIATIVAFISIADGFQASLNAYMMSTGAHIVVFNKAASGLEFSRIHPADAERIRNLEIGGKKVVEELARGAFYASKDPGRTLPSILLFGRHPDERPMRSYENADLRGRTIRTAGEVMLGAAAAEKLEKKIGDDLTINPVFGGEPVALKIVGIFRAGIPWEDAGVVVHVELIQKFLAMGETFSVGFVYLRDARQVEAAKRALEGDSALQHLLFSQPADFTKNFRELEYVDWFVWIISIIAVFVGALGVLNTMMMSVNERVREIGTLRAVGWSRARVARLIVAEGLIISLIGGALGLALGVAGAELVIRTTPPGVFMPTAYAAATFAKALLVALSVGFLGSAIPAVQASRLQPAEALRYE